MNSRGARWLFLWVISCGIAAAQDTALVNQYNKTVYAIRETHLDSALALSLQAQRVADSLGYIPGLTKALENAGWIYYRQGTFNKSIEYSFQALRLASTLQDPVRVANLHNNIGAVYYAQRQYPEAVAEFKKGLALIAEVDHVKTRWRTLNNISFMFLSMGRFDSAEYYSNQSLALEKQEENVYLSSFSYRNQGDIYRETGRLREALASYRTAMKLAEAGGILSTQVATRPRIAALLIAFGEWEKGIAMLKENLGIARTKGFDVELLLTYKELAAAWTKKGFFEQAARVQAQYIALNDSISERRWSSQLAALETLHELDLKETRIGLLTREKALQQATIFRQRVLLGGATLGLALLTLAGVLFWNYTRKLSQAKQKIENKEGELIERNRKIEQQRLELERLNASKDKLFSIIGHDFRSPLQSLRGLLALMNQDSLTPQEFAHYSKDLKGRIDILYDNLDNLLHWSVAQINGIQTQFQIVEVRQAYQEIANLYEDVALQKKVTIRNQLVHDMLAFADGDQLRLVLRNLVSNAIKFSNPGGVVILGVDVIGADASLFVKDVGLGIDPVDLSRLFVKDSLWSQRGTQQEKGLGIGLLLCQEFLEKNNSRLEVVSQPGKGTTFSFKLRIADTKAAPRKKPVVSLL